jgi:ferredoxin
MWPSYREGAVTFVWIDPHECMGAGTCEEIAPEVFVDRGDGLWAVKEDAAFFGTETIFDGNDGPDGADGRARVPDKLITAVIDAAEQCPGECVYLEA